MPKKDAIQEAVQEVEQLTNRLRACEQVLSEVPMLVKFRPDAAAVIDTWIPQRLRELLPDQD